MTVAETAVQRWRRGASRWRPVGETICTREYEVAAIPDDTTAKAFIVATHYSGSFPCARFRFGLWHRRDLVGVAVFSHPVNERSLAPLPGEPLESAELGRFVLTDRVPANGETFFLGRCFELLRRVGLLGVVSFSDPVPRRTLAGAVVLPGHVGITYQAHNGVYLGRASPSTIHLLQDGCVVSPRALQKIKKMERSARYAIELLEHHGAAPFDRALLAGDEERRRAWLAQALAMTTRRFRHGGNHKYVWALDRRVHKWVIKDVAARSPNGVLPPFPKRIDPEPPYGPPAAAAHAAGGLRR
jgi:hypothetical protein